MTCFVAEQPIAPGLRVRLAGLDVGEVLAACLSPTLGQTVGSALLDRRFAHPHLTLSAVTGEALFKKETPAQGDAFGGKRVRLRSRKIGVKTERRFDSNRRG